MDGWMDGWIDRYIGFRVMVSRDSGNITPNITPI